MQGLVHSVTTSARGRISRNGFSRSLSMTRGCPLGTIGNEVTANDELIRQDLNLIFEVIRGKLAGFFIQEKARGRLAADVRERSLADFCIGTIQGALLMGKITHDTRTAE